MDEPLRQEVWDRAGDACEYCRLPQRLDLLPFQIDHVISIKHHGPTSAANLALSCCNCNVHKGPNLAGLDPDTGVLTRLFHPRNDDWDYHFCWAGPELVGRTAIGRTTIDVLISISLSVWNTVAFSLRLACSLRQVPLRVEAALWACSVPSARHPRAGDNQT